MYEVLLALDTAEERARSQAEAVVDLPDAPDSIKVTIFHVFRDNPEGASVTQLATVHAVRDVFDEAGVDYSLAESSGDPASEILDEASDRDSDCICVSGRRRSPAGKALFGSTTQGVILDADRPVLVAPPQGK